MTLKTILMTAAVFAVFIAPAFAASESVVTTDGTTTTTTTHYFYPDSDANHNGILDSQEFGRYVYDRWDLNGDGYISDAEWAASTPRWYPKNYTEYKTYSAWDANHDGRLDPAEFGTVVTTTNLYNTWDVNSDQKIENDEYARSTFRIYDANDDGNISLAEWQAAQ